MGMFIFALITLNHAQNKLPDVEIRSLNGSLVSASSLSNEGKPIIVSFWATWCKSCMEELETINDELSNWQNETGVKVVAVSVDDTRSSARVKSLVAGKQWDFDIYLDTNQDLKRALNVVNIPFTLILNGEGEIVWKHTGYTPGVESEILEVLKGLN